MLKADSMGVRVCGDCSSGGVGGVGVSACPRASSCLFSFRLPLMYDESRLSSVLGLTELDALTLDTVLDILIFRIVPW